MEFLNKQDYILSNIQQNIELIMYTALCFFMPFFIGHPQLVVGIAVNAALVLAALNLKGYKALPIIILPSVAVLSRGLVFGPFTMFLIYMIPFVWIGNSLLVFSIKYLNLHKNKNRYFAIGVGIAAKVAFLFVSAYVLFSLGIIPAAILGAMGLLQLYTAIAGSALALGIHEAKKKFA